MREQGLGSLGATLAARILTLGPEYWITNWLHAPGEGAIIYVPPDTAPDAPYGFVPHSVGGLHFPYGIDVTPDVLL